MRKEEIQKLIDRYFEGETTLEEERRLYRFFQKDNIPAEFEEYTEMFRDFAAADNAFVPCIPAKRPVRIKFTWLRAAVSAAAIAAIVFGIRTVCDISEENALAKLYEGSYMIVDGQRIDNLREMKDSIKATLDDASKLEHKVANLQTVEGTEQDILRNVSDPDMKKQIEKLLN